MLNKGQTGLFVSATGATARASVTRLRGGNLFDLSADGLPPSETQMVGLAPGITEHGHFEPDGHEPMAFDEAPTPPVRLVPVAPPASHLPALIAIGIATASLALSLAELLLR